MVAGLLDAALRRDGAATSSLRVLDLGAGDGLVGEQRRAVGAGHLVGLDIIAEPRRQHCATGARCTTTTWSPTSPPCPHPSTTGAGLGAMSYVAALDYADVPPAAFRSAFNLVADGGWIAFTIKDRFLATGDTSGFATLINRCREPDVLDVRGNPLHYVALVGRKRADIPAELVP